MKRLLLLIATMLAAQLLSGCYVYSAFQGARTLAPGKVSVTPAVSFLSFHNDGESDDMTNNYGVQAALGLADKVNLTARYERLNLSEGDGDGYNYADFGIKVSLVRDRLAFALPIGAFFGEDAPEDSWQAHPTLLMTLPAHSHVDVNASAKYLHFFDDPDEGLVAFNAGFGLRLLPNKLTVYPEVGVLLNPGEEGNYFHWGVGLGVEF